jgi:hypothetical protein
MNLVSHRPFRIATAVVSMSAFSAVFFALPFAGVAAVAVLCLLTLSGVLWMGARTDRSVAQSIASFRSSGASPGAAAAHTLGPGFGALAPLAMIRPAATRPCGGDR